MSGAGLEWNSVEQQLESLRTLMAELRHEVAELRAENIELRREVGYWKSMHARVVERNIKLQAELDAAKAEIRQLKDERFGKKSEKQSRVDRSNQLDDPQQRQDVPKSWWLWLFAGDDSVAYVLDATRSHDVPESHFGSAVEGVLMEVPGIKGT